MGKPSARMTQKDDIQNQLTFDQRAHAKARYDEQHVHCPKCGSDHITRTTVVFSLLDMSRYKDRNRAVCCNRQCRWAGIVHELTE